MQHGLVDINKLVIIPRAFRPLSDSSPNRL